MAKISTPLTQSEVFASLVRLRQELDKRAAQIWFEELTGRDLYEMDTINLKNKSVIDRPVALGVGDVAVVLSDEEGPDGENAEDIDSVDADDIMTACMVDGVSVVRLGSGWDEVSLMKIEHMPIIKTDAKGCITFIRIQHQIEKENQKELVWFRRDYFEEPQFKLNEDGELIRDREDRKFFKQDWPLVDDLEDLEKVSPLEPVEIEFIPFVAFEWNKAHISFILPAKRAFLELERVSIDISGENVKHSKRKLHVKIPQDAKVELTDLNDKINLLSKDGDAFYPNPHAEAMNSFFRERTDQKEFIEDYTGIVPTEKIATLSGISRITAMTSTIKVAKKVRRIFVAGMVRIEKIFKEFDEAETKELLILFPPIGMMIVDVNNQATLLETAHDKGHIDNHEFKESNRMMLGL